MTATIPEDELIWKFARSGGPGGQNVNKVASKAILSWDFTRSAAISDRAKERIPLLFPRYATTDGWLVIASQLYRDQDRNRQNCLDKLHALIAEADKIPKVRRPTKPSRGSKRRRLEDKKLRADVKENRRRPGAD